MTRNKNIVDNKISTTVDCDTYKKLFEMSVKEDRSIAYLVRRLIVEGVNKYER